MMSPRNPFRLQNGLLKSQTEKGAVFEALGCSRALLSSLSGCAHSRVRPETRGNWRTSLLASHLKGLMAERAGFEGSVPFSLVPFVLGKGLPKSRTEKREIFLAFVCSSAYSPVPFGSEHAQICPETRRNSGFSLAAVEHQDYMAEGEGFEPPVPFRVQRFSRPPVSTAHPSLRGALSSSSLP